MCIRDRKRAIGLINSKGVYRYTYIHKIKTEKLKKNIQLDNKFTPFVKSKIKKHTNEKNKLIFYVCPINFEFINIKETIESDFIISDVIDDQTKWPHSEERKKSIEFNYEETLSSSDFVLTNSEKVREKMCLLNKKTFLVPNAAEIETKQEINKKPSLLRNINSPIIGYIGNLDAIRLDVELIEYIARERPDWSFVFIGSSHQNMTKLSISKAPNIHILGVVPYKNLQNYSKYFDAAIIPHLDNELTQSMDPLKLYVYLSLGVPIISTTISHLPELDKLIFIAKNKKDFLKKIDHVISEKITHDPETLTEVLTKNSWQARINKIFEILKSIER